MTKHTTTLAQWDAKADQQKVEWLATNILKFHRRNVGAYGMEVWSEYSEGPVSGRADRVIGVFNPLTDQNHWRQVEEKVMENDNLWMEFIKRITIEKERVVMLPWEIGMIDYMKADLPTRARALYLAFQRHYDSGK